MNKMTVEFRYFQSVTRIDLCEEYKREAETDESAIRMFAHNSAFLFDEAAHSNYRCALL